MCSFLLLQDVGGGSCITTSTRFDVGGESTLFRCGRWELCCHSDEMWEVGVVLPLRRNVGGGSCAATPTRRGRWESSLQMWEVGAMLPLRQGWRWESSFQMWKVGVLSPDVGGGSCAASPTKCGRWELRCYSDEVGVGVLSPNVGGGSCAATPTRCGRWESSL